MNLTKNWYKYLGGFSLPSDARSPVWQSSKPESKL